MSKSARDTRQHFDADNGAPGQLPESRSQTIDGQGVTR
jgi:hypothetical protein